MNISRVLLSEIIFCTFLTKLLLNFQQIIQKLFDCAIKIHLIYGVFGADIPFEDNFVTYFIYKASCLGFGVEGCLQLLGDLEIAGNRTISAMGDDNGVKADSFQLDGEAFAAFDGTFEGQILGELGGI